MTLRARVRSCATLVTAAAMALGGFTSLAAPADAATRTSINARVPSSVKQYTKPKVTGTVKPGRPSRRVTLQRYSRKHWRKVSSSRTRNAGRFSLTVPAANTGVATYRVAVPAARGARARKTASFRVTVKAEPKVVVTVTTPGTPPGTTPATTGAGNPQAYAFLSQSSDASAKIARWNPCAPIGYRVNTALASAGALADVQGAVARVSEASGLTFVYRGDTTVLPGGIGDQQYPVDTNVVIAWATPGSTSYLTVPPQGSYGPAGQGGAYWSTGYDKTGSRWGMMSEGFVVLDAGAELAAGFGAGPTSGWQGTRGQLLMHELGHTVGLGHPAIDDNMQIMYPSMTRKEAKWGAGDLTALSVVGTANDCLSSRNPLGTPAPTFQPPALVHGHDAGLVTHSYL